MKVKMLSATLVIIILFITLFIALNTNSVEAAQFQGNDFENNIEIEFGPQQPIEYQTVNVTINSRHGVPIIQADLWIDIKGPEYTSSGAYPMNKFNSTSRFVVLNGYASHTNVSFYITAYDGATELTSDTYYYDVIAKESWNYLSFSQNLDLKFSPDPPMEGESVLVTIESKNMDVKIKRADINIEVELLDVETPIAGGQYMELIDDYTCTATIPPYPGHANITFQIKAWDTFGTTIESRKYSYTVTPPPEEFLYGIYVVVFNNITHQYMEANITVSNGENYYTQGETVNGIFWTQTDMPSGKYRIEVTPINGHEGDKKNINIVLGEGTKNFQFTIFYGAEDISTEKAVVEFPTLQVFAGFLFMILPIPLLLRYHNKHKSSATKKKINDGDTSTSNIIHRLMATINNNFDYKKNVSMALAFSLLGFLSSTWCTFYPWWMVLMVSIITGAIGYRFPYISLLFISFVAIGATGWQTAQFGLMFMVFSLFVCVCALFNWKFGYLTLLMVFLSTYGLSFIVPIIAILLFSLFLSTTVTIVSGLFITLMASVGNLTNLSFIVSKYSVQKESVITFAKTSAGNGFTPEKYIDAVSGIRHLDLTVLGNFVKNYLTTMVPLVQTIFWILAVVAIYLLKKNMNKKKKEPKALVVASIGYGIILVSTLGGMLFADFTLDAMFGREQVIAYILAFPVILSSVLLGTAIKKYYREFFQDQQQTNIGTRIGDMINFRQTNFREVGGLKVVKEEIKDSIVGPLLKPMVAKKYGVKPPKGMILFGPPGCGKTLLMRVIATELDVEMIGVKCSDVMSKWYGESENLISGLFVNARERKPCLLFLDEIDAIAKRRDFYSADDVTPRLLSIMLSEMDGMDDFSEIVIIAATNRPELIDPALLRPGRFDKIVYVPPPDKIARKEILKIHFRGKPIGRDVDIDRIADNTARYSGADLANLTRECAITTMKRSIKNKKSTRITMTDFEKMIDILKPSISKEVITEYEELQETFERKIKKVQPGKKKRKKIKKGKIDKTRANENVGWIEEDL